MHTQRRACWASASAPGCAHMADHTERQPSSGRAFGRATPLPRARSGAQHQRTGGWATSGSALHATHRTFCGSTSVLTSMEYADPGPRTACHASSLAIMAACDGCGAHACINEMRALLGRNKRKSAVSDAKRSPSCGELSRNAANGSRRSQNGAAGRSGECGDHAPCFRSRDAIPGNCEKPTEITRTAHRFSFARLRRGERHQVRRGLRSPFLDCTARLRVF